MTFHFVLLQIISILNPNQKTFLFFHTQNPNQETGSTNCLLRILYTSHATASLLALATALAEAGGTGGGHGFPHGP